MPFVALNAAFAGRTSGACRTRDAQVASLGKAAPTGKVEKWPEPPEPPGATVVGAAVVEGAAVVVVDPVAPPKGLGRVVPVQQPRPIRTEHADLDSVGGCRFVRRHHPCRGEQAGLPATKDWEVHAFCRARPLGVNTSRSTTAEVLVDEVTLTVNVMLSPIRTLEGLIAAIVVHPFEVAADDSLGLDKSMAVKARATAATNRMRPSHRL